MTPLFLLLFKIAVPPVLVAAMSLAAQRWGATVGGLFIGLPWMTGPVLYFLARDKGADFAVAAATGVELGLVPIGGFMLAYALLATVAAWPLCLLAAVAAFAALAALVRLADVSLITATAIALASLAVTYVLLPRPTGPSLAPRLPWWDIPARMAITFGLVAIIMTGVDRFGSRLSGIFATFPVIVTVIGTFTHHQSGRNAIQRLLRSITLSLLSFIAFFLVVGLSLPHVGLAASYGLAVATSICVSATLMTLERR